MINRSFAASARKNLLRRGRALLRLRRDGSGRGSGPPDCLAGLSDAERTELAEIHSALERIERGIYGRCDDCFGDIEPERLEARLWARKCGSCAARAEARPPAVAP